MKAGKKIDPTTAEGVGLVKGGVESTLPLGKARKIMADEAPAGGDRIPNPMAHG